MLDARNAATPPLVAPPMELIAEATVDAGLVTPSRRRSVDDAVEYSPSPVRHRGHARRPQSAHVRSLHRDNGRDAGTIGGRVLSMVLQDTGEVFRRVYVDNRTTLSHVRRTVCTHAWSDSLPTPPAHTPASLPPCCMQVAKDPEFPPYFQFVFADNVSVTCTPPPLRSTRTQGHTCMIVCLLGSGGGAPCRGTSRARSRL